MLAPRNISALLMIEEWGRSQRDIAHMSYIDKRDDAEGVYRQQAARKNSKELPGVSPSPRLAKPCIYPKQWLKNVQ